MSDKFRPGRRGTEKFREKHGGYRDNRRRNRLEPFDRNERRAVAEPDESE